MDSESSSDPCAANALHGCDAKCLRASPIDAELQSVMDTWDLLPTAIRAAVLALVASQQRTAE